MNEMNVLKNQISYGIDTEFIYAKNINFKPEVKRIESKDVLYLRKGEVVLVRSLNVPEYGDHYIIVTGAPKMKPTGLRPVVTIVKSPFNELLDEYDPHNGTVLLQLLPQSRDYFLKFYNL